jgi:hypothetical protein
MGDILRRRGMMMQAGAGPTPSGPLYPSSNFMDSSISGFTVTVTNGNHFAVIFTKYVSNYQTRTANYSAFDAAWADWMPLNAGDVVVMELKNISYYNSKTTTRGFECNFRETGTGNALFGFVNALGTRIYIPAGTGTIEDKTATTTISSNTGVSALRFWDNNTSGTLEVEMDIEVTVNGIRYL